MPKFKQIKQRQFFVTFPLFAAAIGLMGFIKDTGFEWVSFVLLMAAVIFSLYNWRCPSCKGYLGKNISPKFCHKCGKELI